MGRNKKDPTEIKKNTTIRLSDTERDQLIAQGSALGFKELSEYIRFCALNSKKTIHIMPEINASYFAELKKIGVNLNQIAFQLNAKVIPNKEVILEVLDKSSQHTLTIIEELRKQYKKNEARFEGGNKE